MSISISDVATNNIIGAAETGTAITGTKTAGATVTLTFDGIAMAGTLTYPSTTTWSYILQPTDIASMGQGPATIVATATGAGAASTFRNITVDTLLPSLAITDNGGVTATGLVTFTFTFLEPVTGFDVSDIVVAGGAKRAFAAQSATVYTLQVLPTAGVAAGNITVNVAANAAYDLAGNGNTAAAQNTQPYNTLNLVPAVPVPLLSNTVSIPVVIDNHGLIQGSLTSGGRTSDNKLDLSGTLAGGLNPGDVVKVYDGGILTPALGTATVSGNSWVFTDPRTLSNGQGVSYSVRVENGATVGTASPAFTTTVDKTAPVALADVSDITDNVTPVGTALVPVTVAKGGTTNDISPTLVITTPVLAVGDTVHVYRNGVDIGVAALILPSTTSWTFTDNSSGFIQGNTYRYQARVWDAAGNAGASNQGYVINFASTAATPAVTGVTEDRGEFTTDRITSDQNLFISGTADPGATVRVYETSLGGQLTSTATGLADTVADGLGNWVFNYSDVGDTLNAGSYAFSAQQTDLAGNISATSAPISVVIDITPPAQSATITTVGDNVGSIQIPLTNTGVGSYTDDLQPTLAITVTATPTGGDVVAVYDGTTRLGNATLVSGTNYTFTDPRTTLGHGKVLNYTAVVEDMAGNSNPTTPYVINIDLAAPDGLTTLLVHDDAPGLIQGDLKALGATSTDDTQLVLSGVLDGPLRFNEVLVLYNGATKLGNIKLDANGLNWSYSDVTRANGSTVQYNVRVEDSAGNLGVATSSVTITIDTTPPTGTATITSFDDNLAPTISPPTVANGGSSNDNTPLIGGTVAALLAGESVAVLRNGVYIGESSAGLGATTWTYQDTAPDGVNSYTAFVRDLAGNVGAASAAYVVTVDTIGPAMITGGAFTTVTAAASTVTLPFSENIVASTAGLSILKNNAGGNLVSSAAAATNVLSVTTASTTLAQTDYLLVTYDKTVAGGIVDTAILGNEPNSFTRALGGTGANTINLSAFTPTLGLVTIEGGLGIDTLTGSNFNDTFVYATSADFAAPAGAVVDSIVGGSGLTDKIQISGAITLGSGTTLATRLTNVEQLVAATATTGLTHDIVLINNANLGSIRTIDLSGNTGTSATIKLAGVTNAINMTVKGVSTGTNTITGGAGVDTLSGGAGADTFLYATSAEFAASGGAAVDSLVGGLGTDRALISGAITLAAGTDLSRVTGVEQLVLDTTAAALTHNIVLGSSAKAGSISTIDLSGNTGGTAATVTLTGMLTNMTIKGINGATGTGAGTNSITGGSGSDTITGGTGADTITGGEGADVIDVFDFGNAENSVDTVIVNVDESGVSGIDKIYGFYVDSSDGDELDLPPFDSMAGQGFLDLGAVSVDGTDVGIIKTHTTLVNPGMISFDDVTTFASALIVNSNGIAANTVTVETATAYLATNLALGQIVAFYVDGNNDGDYIDTGATGDYLRVFMGMGASDIYVDMYSLNVSAGGLVNELGSADGANRLKII